MEAKLLGIFSSCLSLEVTILGKSGPTHQSVLRSPRANNNPGGITAPPISKQAAHRPPAPPISKQAAQRPPGTQLPLIPPRDKAPPTRGIGISSTYQWAGFSPSHQEAYSKLPYPLQPQEGWTSGVQLLSAKRRPHQKPMKMKRQRTIPQTREQEKTPDKQISDV